MKKVENTSVVKFNYTGKLEDGSVFDSSLTEGREPLVATLGQGQLIPGFESGLLEMSEGENKTIEIEPDQAYGLFREDLIDEVTKDKVPETVQPGDMLQAWTPQGPRPVKVLEVKEETVVLDANHPLAGQKLIFELELVGLE